MDSVQLKNMLINVIRLERIFESETTSKKELKNYFLAIFGEKDAAYMLFSFEEKGFKSWLISLDELNFTKLFTFLIK